MLNQYTLVLSGGGARGIAHIGVVKALREKGIEIKAVAGTSAGALVGALFAAGVDADEMLELVGSSGIFSPVNIRPGISGLFKTDTMGKLIRKHLPHTFEELPIPVFVTATDLVWGREMMFSEGNLLKPLVASACIPGIFRPVQIDDMMLVDGGVMNNFPTEPLQKFGLPMIGVNVNSLPVPDKPKSWNMLKIAEKCYHLAIEENLKDKLEKCSIVIQPQLYDIRSFQVGKAKEIARRGYETAMAALEARGY